MLNTQHRVVNTHYRIVLHFIYYFDFIIFWLCSSIILIAQAQTALQLMTGWPHSIEHWWHFWPRTKCYVQQTQCSSTLKILVNSYYGPFSRTISVLKSTGRHASSIGIASYDALGHVPPPLELAHVGLHQIWQFLLTYNLQWAMVDCYWTQHITVPATFHTESVQFCSFAVYYIYVVISAWFHEHARRAPSPSPGSKCWQRH